MIKNLILRLFVSIPLLVTAVNAQDGVDAIEKARQAKEAADKAAAEAAAATEAAIEAAAAKAAKAARADAKKKKEDDEARKAAEKLAAEEAELDAAATAAAEEAKRKMAQELGLEVAEGETTVATEDEGTEEVIAKESSGFTVGLALSAGFVSGRAFTSVPTGGTVVISTPWGFKLGPLDYTISLAFGGYSGQYDSSKDGDFVLGENQNHWVDDFNPSLVGIGGNLTLADIIFTEGHLGNIGEGMGVRGFMGVTLERLMKKGLNLPVNILVGGEGFVTSDVVGGIQTGWGGLGIRLDYGL